MVFKNERSKKQCYGLLLVFSIIFGVSLGVSSDANAWDLDDPFFPNTTLDLYRSYGSQADGAPYLVTDEHLSNFGVTNWIYDATDSAIQTKKVFGIYAGGFTMSGGNSANKYQTGQAIFYFYTNKASYETFANSLSYKAIYYKLSGQTQEANCTASSSLLTSQPYNLLQQVECRQVSNSNYDPYVRVDLRIGETPTSFDSPAWYVYRNGGGVKFSANIGQYIVSSSDNQSELAMEEINNTLNIIYQQNGEYYQHEYDAIDNIENQDPSDISTGTPTTTTLFELLTQFVTNLAYIPDYSSNCNLTLPFPSYAGGNVQVNPCTNKEKLGNDFLQVWSSLTLICFFVPVCWMLLRMIYGEIRSWTNG